MKQIAIFTICSLLQIITLKAQNQVELNSKWKCINITQTNFTGEQLSNPQNQLDHLLDATVPGTVLTTLINNKLQHDPFWGMNNEKIPDIYNTGSDYYTYWFINDFELSQYQLLKKVLWLNLRGVNYSCDIFLNGIKVNKNRHYGMFLRQTYNISSLINKNSTNRLAIIVYPPNPVGNPNGGQGGDGEIARTVSHQYVAGWDWIQPIRDRNTGIWDKVSIEATNEINLSNPHIITEVLGVREPNKSQDPATIKSTVEVVNSSDKAIKGYIVFETNGQKITQPCTIQKNSTSTISLPNLTISQPKLWWPNGYGKPNLYTGKFSFISNKKDTSDIESVNYGIRTITTTWNSHTKSAQVMVNGQKIFIKGGNWIISDALLRLSPERYDHEVRFHQEMNLNLIRVWGGALLERPEFYDACDKYGMLVMQDFWVSADCNGKWTDPQKKEDQWTRRQYPDDHALFITSAADQVKMIRNHPSLAFWCGGNEIAPPKDILAALSDSILPQLDGTRVFFPYSNSDQMSFNEIGSNGDGPYTIQNPITFWQDKTFPFNSEVGSVGTGDLESLKRFIPKEHLIVPDYKNKKVDSVWQYHRDIGYENSLEAYGEIKDISDFGLKAQLVNYNQYRALAEGFSNKIWDWYTGFMIWKTQNPWTSLRGQMYDYYLDPNACLYGLKCGAEPIHVMLNPIDGMISVVNNTFETHRDLMLELKVFDIDGKRVSASNLLIEVGASLNQKYYSIAPLLKKVSAQNGCFVSLKLRNQSQQVISNNFYWIADENGSYSGLQKMAQSNIKLSAEKEKDGEIMVNITNPEENPIAFFNRISLINTSTQERILPVFYSDNYVTALPGEAIQITLHYPDNLNTKDLNISLEGWNKSFSTFGIQ